MSDATLNRFVAQFADATARTAFVPSPPTPASGPDSGYFAFQQDDGSAWCWDSNGSAWVQVDGGGANTVTAAGTLTSGEPVLGGGSKAVAVGPINLAGGASFITGVLPVANGGTGASDAGPYRVASVTLTDAQYKALPTTGIQVIAAPGAGFTIDIKHAYLLADFAAGAYTGASTTLSWISLQAASVDISSFIANDSTMTPALTYLTGLNGATKKKVWMGPTFDTSEAAGEWGTLTKVIASYIADNAAVSIKATNGGVDFGGGHASNTLRVKVWYTVEATT